MRSCNRIGSVERLEMALRDNDGEALGLLKSYDRLHAELYCIAMGGGSEEDVLTAIADMIEEALDGEYWRKS